MDIQATPADIERLLSQSDWLSALARKLVGDAATADDIVQDTWIAALQNPPDPNRPVRPWLAGILRRVASMRARAEGRRSWRQRRVARKDELPSAASLVGEVDLQQRLSREVLELEEPYRTTLLLRYFHDLPAVEIARRQDIPAGTVRWRLKRGLDDLRRRLDTSFGDRRSWCLAFARLARRAPAAEAGATSAATFLAATVAALALLGLGAWLLVDRGELVEPRGLPSVAAATPSPEGSRTAGLALEREVRRAGGAALIPSVETSGPLTLRIVEPRGYGTAGLRAVALHADGTVTEVRSDEAGVVRFSADIRGGHGSLWVERDGSFIAPARFSHAPGLQEVRLPDGADFVGRLRCDGVANPAALTIEIDSDLMLPWGPLPAPVANILGIGRRARAHTDEQGRFTFHALPADWSGELWLPAGWRLAEHAPRGMDAPPHGRVHVVLADAPLALELARMPMVRGRVVRADGEPADGARVRLRLRWPDGRSGRAEVTCDADGVFEVRLARADLEHLVVSVEHDRGATRASHRRRRTAPALETLDLGELTLVPATSAELVVHGPRGPLAGAWLVPGRGEPLGPTGTDGRLRLSAASGRGWLGATGHRPLRVEWASGTPPVVELELMATARIHLVDAERAPLPWAVLTLPAAVAERSVAPAQLLGLTTRASTTVAGRALASPDGWVELVDMPTGETLRFDLLDALGRRLDTVTLAPLSAGELREATHELRAAPRRLFGRCVDRSGDVLLGVVLDFESANERPMRVRSDPEGRFELMALAPELVTATAAKRGFVRRRVTFPTSDLDQHQELRLERACDLVVHAVDATGEPHEHIELAAQRGEIRWTATETVPGVYTLLDLPREPVILEWARGAARGSVRWDPTAGAAELEIGADGGTVRGR